MTTYDRRTFLKQSAMVTATVATNGLLLPSVIGRRVDHPFFTQAKNRPEVIAHRGGDGQWPGETMYAMRQAVKTGADVLEMDVYLTKDKELVLMHDNNVESTTEIKCLINRKCRVNKFTKAELQNLNAAYHWSNDGKQSHCFHNKKLTVEIPNDLRVPTLEEVFKEFPDKRMVIEMKKAEDSPVAKLCALIQDCHMENNVLVASLWAPFMNEFHEELPTVATSVTPFEDSISWLSKFLGERERNPATRNLTRPV